MWTSLVSRSVKSIALVLAAAAYAGPAMAAFPEQPIRIIVPFAPGGGTDLVARTIGAGMSKDLGQAVIVQNKPGARTMIGDTTFGRMCRNTMRASPAPMPRSASTNSAVRRRRDST